MEKIDIVAFIRLLVEQTEKGKCDWQTDKKGYRLILKSGSVKFNYSFDDMTQGYEYTLSLYDTTELFAVYYVDNADAFDAALFPELEKLRQTIQKWQENRKCFAGSCISCGRSFQN